MLTKTRQEAICLWDEKGHLHAVMLKNGDNSYYKTKKFGFDDHLNLHDDTPDKEPPKGAIRIEA